MPALILQIYVASVPKGIQAPLAIIRPRRINRSYVSNGLFAFIVLRPDILNGNEEILHQMVQFERLKMPASANRLLTL
jgi:hypothetical protein